MLSSVHVCVCMLLWRSATALSFLRVFTMRRLTPLWFALYFFIFLVAVCEEERLDAVAHRGASGESPENTLPAFKLALAQDAAVLEADLRVCVCYRRLSVI